MMAFANAHASGQKRKAIVEAGSNLLWRQNINPRACELDSKRNAIELATDSGD
jgi:hypothetical protein